MAARDSFNNDDKDEDDSMRGYSFRVDDDDEDDTAAAKQQSASPPPPQPPPPQPPHSPLLPSSSSFPLAPPAAVDVPNNKQESATAIFSTTPREIFHRHVARVKVNNAPHDVDDDVNKHQQRSSQPPPATLQDDDLSTSSSSVSIVHDHMTQAEANFLNDVCNTAKQHKTKHNSQARKYRFRDKILGMAARVGSVLVGTAGITSLTQIDYSDYTLWPILVVATLLSIVVAVVTNVQAVLEYDKNFARHVTSYREYSNMIMKISRFLSTPGHSRNDIQHFTSLIVQELESIANDEILV